MESHAWRDWPGYLAPSRYQPLHDHEYYAMCSSAAQIDVSPVFKFEIHEPGAECLVNRLDPCRSAVRLMVDGLAHLGGSQDREHYVLNIPKSIDPSGQDLSLTAMCELKRSAMYRLYNHPRCGRIPW